MQPGGFVREFERETYRIRAVTPTVVLLADEIPEGDVLPRPSHEVAQRQPADEVIGCRVEDAERVAAVHSPFLIGALDLELLDAQRQVIPLLERLPSLKEIAVPLAQRKHFICICDDEAADVRAGAP